MVVRTMVLADTAVWIDHLRMRVPALESLLLSGRVLGHPLVAGELSAGNPRDRVRELRALDRLPQPILARHDEVRQFIELHKLFGRGVGFVDLHLLLSVRLTPDAVLWTRDKRLREVAAEMSVAYAGPDVVEQ